MSRYKHVNKLISETSPYLLQHAHNPVNWFPWGEEALAKAKEENKLLLISIGYSACHWCHVMEHESFEDELIAQAMNKNFICVKVDREERPDIDHVYMNAVQLITGSGGWPLNCFALPDGRPVFGGTYFRSTEWNNILENLSFGYKTNPQKFIDVAKDLKNNIISLDNIMLETYDTSIKEEELNEIFKNLKKRFDHLKGGDLGAPKFPMPLNYLLLMQYYYHTSDHEIFNHVKLSLDKILCGGIYDHLGGGFARYSVDKDWLVPHFEKMLYDNAQLVSLYSKAYLLNPDPNYKRVVEETLDFIAREMMSPDGVFYSAYDADSEGVEGKYYVWDKYEIDFLLKDKSEIFSDYYNITTEGNWEEKNILNIKKSKIEIAHKYDISITELEEILKSCKKTLLEQRIKRQKPTLDDKVLVSWNALMVSGLVHAYQTFNTKKYLDQAEQVIRFIQNNLLDSELNLLRSYKDGESKINAFLDDYAYLIKALIDLYEATFKEEYIMLAHQLTEYTVLHFVDNNSSMFYYTSGNDIPLIARTKELNDHVVPSSNSMMADNLYRLGHLLVNKKYIERAKQMLWDIKERLIKNPTYSANWINLMLKIFYKPYEVCIVGPNYKRLAKQFQKTFIPHIFIAAGTHGDLPVLKNRYSEKNNLIYICSNNTCLKPVESFEEAYHIIKNS